VVEHLLRKHRPPFQLPVPQKKKKEKKRKERKGGEESAHQYRF
jgi:hypothetical protein